MPEISGVDRASLSANNGAQRYCTPVYELSSLSVACLETEKNLAFGEDCPPLLVCHEGQDP